MKNIKKFQEFVNESTKTLRFHQHITALFGKFETLNPKKSKMGPLMKKIFRLQEGFQYTYKYGQGYVTIYTDVDNNPVGASFEEDRKHDFLKKWNL